MIKNIVRSAALAFAAVLAVPSAVSAYDFNGIDVKPRASVSGTYDDNVTFAETGEIDDFITRVSAGLEALAEGKTRTFKAVGNVSHEFFIDNDEFDNTSGDITASFQQELSEYDRIRVKNVFLSAEEARTFEEAFNRLRGRYRYYRNQFYFDYMKDVSKQWTLDFRYANEFTGFSGGGSSDSTFNQAGIEGIYEHSEKLKFLFAYDFAIRDFESGGDSYTNTLSTGAKYYFTNQLYFEGRVGVDFIESFSNESFTEPLVRARIADDIDERTTVDVAFEMEFAPNSYTEDIFDYWQVSSSIQRQLLERLAIQASVFYGEGDYVDSNRNDSLWGANAALHYDITKDLKGTLRYTFTEVESTLVSQEYTRNTVLLGLALQF